MPRSVMVIPTIASDQNLNVLRERLTDATGVVHVSGLWGSCAPMLAAIVAERSKRLFVYVVAHLEEADHARDDLELFLSRRCELFPAWETLPGEGATSGEIEAERLRICAELHAAGNGLRSNDRIIVSPIQGLMQPVPTPTMLERNTLRVRLATQTESRGSSNPTSLIGVGKPRGPEAILAWAIDRGFERLDLVESPGDVAKRGDIVDLFALGESQPFRIHFFGDEVESIHRFDIGTQRSTESLDELAVTAMPKCPGPGDEPPTHLCSYLPDDAVVVLDGPSGIQTMGDTLRTRLGASAGLEDVSDTLGRLARFTQLHLSTFTPAAISGEEVFDMGVTSVSRFEGSAADSVAELCQIARDRTVHVFCDNEGQKTRLTKMISEADPDADHSIKLDIGVLHRGFEWTASKTLVLPHHEIFNRQRQKRRIRRLHAGRPLETWLDLKSGDVVVHVTHGIALYRGLKKMQKGASQQEEEFLRLEFADKAIIYVPCSQIDLVQKYIGAGRRRPQLSTIGGKRWSKAKEKAAEAVAEMAESLLRVQALRDHAPGTAYPPDTEWQREFEAAFPFEETEDQLIVAGEIREDLRRSRPMDRLVCGDVGYGKTELAMRAAFKIAEYGRQVAILVPTTVLAEQHYATFRDRMAEYPFAIACLSRFRGAAEQRKIVEQVKQGRIDILIGTHRLLSKDVAFADLGLVVIDEEQRFGVKHKERLKDMRETVDILTLTATPIPRTLNMALMGLRDISSLQTPPVDRRSIVTQVSTFNRSLIRDAILREMNRDGQTYFVHNFVQSIAAMADTVQSIVPEARIEFAHGQMKDDQLEAVMHRFVNREADVLVTTTIIESGLDIPSVNTIFIDRAERFGLADLHQLRGRVGRSSHRAHCYLLLSQHRPPTDTAAKRLKTIEEFSELGAGFRIAMRDLEIRGAGNLLGREQSGHISAIGYEMYCRMLDQTVRRMKNEPDPNPPPVQVDLDVAAHIPRHYMGADRSRIEIYRRIVGCRTEEDLVQLERDLGDAFGPLPREVGRLLQVAEIRVHARRFGVLSITLRPPDIVFVVKHRATVEPLFKGAPGSVRSPDAKTIYLRLPSNYLEPDTLLPVLRRLFVRAHAHAEVD